MSLSSYFVTHSSITPVLTRRKLSYLLTAALLTTSIAGCSNSTSAPADSSLASSVDSSSVSVSADSDAAVVQALQANFDASGIEETIVSAVPTDMQDIYWVSAEGLPSFFTDKAGKHIIQGQIIAVGDAQPIDISAALMANTASEALKTVDKQDMVIYPATGTTKAVVYAFTDADCGYCRKLHAEMSDINARGIEVRYLAWPRSQESVPKMEAVWCSEDRNAAMNQAKMGANIQGPSCVNPVSEQMALGARLGVRGTPAIFTESGQQVGGYLPADQLAQAIEASL